MRVFWFAALAVLAAGCSRSKPPIVVGSRNSTEQMLVGEVVAQHLERRLGRKITRRLNIGNTQQTHAALVGHEIDLYAENTASAMLVVLKEKPPADMGILLERLRQEYRRGHLVEWLAPLGLDSRYVVAVRGDMAAQHRLKTLSDAAAVKEGFRVGFGFDFQDRADGIVALNSYRIQWSSAPSSFDGDRLFRAFRENQIDMMAFNNTDGRASRTGYVLLEDDRKVFLPQWNCIAVRQDALAAEPALHGALAELSGKFSNQAWREMTYQADVIRRPLAEVAAGFVKTLP